MLALSPNADLSRSELLRQRSRGQIYLRITQGYGSMPAFSHKLERGDVELLVDYVLELEAHIESEVRVWTRSVSRMCTIAWSLSTTGSPTVCARAAPDPDAPASSRSRTGCATSPSTRWSCARWCTDLLLGLVAKPDPEPPAR